MTWSNFTSLVVICYALYYGINIVFDLLKTSKSVGDETSDILEFDEISEPAAVDPERFLPENESATTPRPDPEVIGSKSNGSNSEELAQKAIDQKEEEDGIGLIHIETVQQNPISGGVSYSELFRLCREKAIVESAKFNFG